MYLRESFKELEYKHMNIAILGGGFTGITAAYELLKQGHKVTIIEKAEELGGLASGFKMHSEDLEKTYHHIFKTDTDIISLVSELGLEDKLEWRDSSVSIYYDGKILPFNGALDLLKFKPLDIISRFRLGFVVLYLQKTKNWKHFEKISAYDWMKKYAGENAVRVIWEPLLRGKFSEYFDKVSMAWLWARLHIRANSRKFGEGEKLGYFKGGFNVIVKAFQNKITEMGGNIYVNSLIERVSVNTKLKIQFQKDGNTQELSFDKVISTLPSQVMAKMIDSFPNLQGYINQLSSINYLGAICLIFSSDQDLSKYYWHNINDLNSPFLVFINHTKLIPKDRYEGKNIYYIGAYLPHEHRYFSLSQEEIEAEWFAYLQKIFPSFETSKVIQKHLFKFKNAQHIVDLDYASKIPKYETPVPGLYLANFSQIYPEDRGTNFAIREGIRVAARINNS